MYIVFYGIKQNIFLGRACLWHQLFFHCLHICENACSALPTGVLERQVICGFLFFILKKHAYFLGTAQNAMHSQLSLLICEHYAHTAYAVLSHA